MTVEATGTTMDFMAQIEQKRKELAVLEQKTQPAAELASPPEMHESPPIDEVQLQEAAEAKGEQGPLSVSEGHPIQIAQPFEDAAQEKPSEPLQALVDSPPSEPLTLPQAAPVEPSSSPENAPAIDPFPYGKKLDGTPKSKPGPKKNTSTKMTTKQVVPVGKSENAPYGYKADNTPKSKPGPKPSGKVKVIVKTSKVKAESKTGKASTNWSQNGGSISLKVEELNATEKAVLLGLSGLTAALAEPRSIADLAELAFPDESDPTKANYKTRNGLRRLVKAGLAKKVSRGRYIPSKKTVGQVYEHIMSASA